MELPDLPITEILPELVATLRASGAAVVQAPPGAGKTTLAPLAMLNADLVTGKILMLEPRRLATRAAAERMAEILGEKVGETIGYRIRGEAKTSRKTRIEVVTEGILTAMIQSDPSLSGIGAVIFDEFHERSLNGDLGLALVWEARAALREDLRVLVMSATLDAEPIANMLKCPIITSSGRAFPVETIWLNRPTPKTRRFEDAMVDLVLQAIDSSDGSILAFLPGEGEIRRVEARLKPQLAKDFYLHPLFGTMDFHAQRAAIAPAKRGRKLVLATSIAETSLTISGISTVVDCGRARRARFDPGSGMSRLVTERVTKAEAEQRRGRAGRMEHGLCYRMWTQGEEGGFAQFPPAEIETGDLCSLVLDLALWGAKTPQNMVFLTQPGAGAYRSATDLLRDLGALDEAGLITGHGRKLANLPLHPRLAHMLVLGGSEAAQLAALLGERDPMRNSGVDLQLRLQALKTPTENANHDAIKRIRREATRLGKHAGGKATHSWAELAALAYPDRIGLRRVGDAPRWILSGGKEAIMQGEDPLAGARLIVVTDLEGDARQARIRQAIAINESELRALFDQKISWQDICHWSARTRRVETRRQETFGALVLQDRHWKDPPHELVAAAALAGIREIGLKISVNMERFCARVELVRATGADLPDMSNDGLLDTLETWLLPHLGAVRSAADIRALELLQPLRQSLTWEQQQLLDQCAPPQFTTPMKRQVAIDYGRKVPEIAVRLQEMFGVTTHPSVAKQPLRITLLSPAGRPLQTTTDLPGFWASSYADVRKDMRGRYPKHPWPEDPTVATPTLRAKPRRR